MSIVMNKATYFNPLCILLRAVSCAAGSVVGRILESVHPHFFVVKVVGGLGIKILEMSNKNKRI